MEPIIWLGVLAVLLVVEAITAGLTTIWFAGGALIAAVASYFGVGLVAQILLFLIISIVLLIFTRPLAVRFMNQDVEKTNVNGLIGKKAVVTEEVDNLAQTGKVKINDVDWRARTAVDGQRIPAKTIVTIEAVKGVKLIVKEYKEG